MATDPKSGQQDGQVEYTLTMRSEGGGEDYEHFADLPEVAECKERLGEWVRDGDWGAEGASVSASWTLTDADGDEVDSGSVLVEIEPDHDALIRAAGGEPDCTDGDGHDWTSEGEGGCDENPGVWSLGGTAMSFASHCAKCGLRRCERTTGSQRNPGEHDTVSYEMPEEAR